MLFKFRSKACADLVMLEPDGRRILKAMIGDDPLQGIVQVSDMSAALIRLEAAVAADEALRKTRADQAAARAAGQDAAEEEQEPALPAIRLAQRATPMLQMLRRCLAEEADLVWGV